MKRGSSSTTLQRVRRWGATHRLLTNVSLFLAMTPVRVARAEEPKPEPPATARVEYAPQGGATMEVATDGKVHVVASAATEDESAHEVRNAEQDREHIRKVVASYKGGSSTSPADDTPPPAVASDPPPIHALALPTGGDKTGVSSQSISLPSGSGTVQGMGESFSAQLSTGIATFSVPIALPAARGAAQPSLALSYSSSGGHGVAGVGWDIGVPFIARQTDRGIPQYNDPATGGAGTPSRIASSSTAGRSSCRSASSRGGACAGALAGRGDAGWADGLAILPRRAWRARSCASSGRRTIGPGGCRTRAA